MSRVQLNLHNPEDLKVISGQWRFASGLVPGEPNEGLVAQMKDSPARLADYDDSSWDIREDLSQWHSQGLTFAWYRITVTLPEIVRGREVRGTRCIFETCIDDYGEVWIDGKCDVERGAIEGFNRPQRVVVSTTPQPGDQHVIALLAINGPLAAPGGAVFIRFSTLAFEWVP